MRGIRQRRACRKELDGLREAQGSPLALVNEKDLRVLEEMLEKAHARHRSPLPTERGAYRGACTRSRSLAGNVRDHALLSWVASTLGGSHDSDNAPSRASPHSAERSDRQPPERAWSRR